MKDEGVHKQLDSLFEALHNQYSISKLFVEGFCWGGNYALELAATDKVRLCSTLMAPTPTVPGPHSLSCMWLNPETWCLLIEGPSPGGHQAAERFPACLQTNAAVVVHSFLSQVRRRHQTAHISLSACRSMPQ